MKNLKLIIICWLIFIIGVVLLVKLNAQEVKFQEVEKLVIQSRHADLTLLPIELYELNPTNDTLTIVRNITAICVLDLLKEYSAECYADSESVLMGYFKHWDTGEIFKARHTPRGGVMTTNLIETKYEYIHREPTFIGFMAFLDEKYKQ